MFGIQTATSEEDVAELVPLVLDELRKMTDGVTDAELQRAKAQLRAGLLMTLEEPARARRADRPAHPRARPPADARGDGGEGRCRRTTTISPSSRGAMLDSPPDPGGDRTGRKAARCRRDRPPGMTGRMAAVSL